MEGVKSEAFAGLEDKLLSAVAKDLLGKISAKKNVSSVAQAAFLEAIDGGEEVQVQIVVTRNKKRFIDDFVTVEGV